MNSVDSIPMKTRLLGYGVSQTLLIRLGIVFALFVFAYFNAISLLIKTWLSRNDYSHGFLIPFISLYLIYVDRQKLKHLSLKPNLFGGLLLLSTGSLILIMGNVGAVVRLQQYAILLTIPGLVLVLLGTGYLRALALPITYLIFMVPILDVVISRIRFPFQFFSAKIASMFLNLLNIPVFREAQYLRLPNIALEVADVCSGINYLVSITALGVPIAVLTRWSWWRKILLVLFALMIGILVNPLRVALIGIWSYSGGEGIHGPFHILNGLSVSVVGFVVLLAGVWILGKIPYKKVKESTKKQENSRNHTPAATKRFNLAWLTSIFVLLAVGSYVQFYDPKPVSLRTSLNEMPLTIGEWRGQDSRLRKAPFGIEGADVELMRTYGNTSGNGVNLYVGYFESQRQGKELIHYRQRRLYNNTEEILIRVRSSNPVHVNMAVLNEGTQDHLVLYWYDINGTIVANRYKAKAITALEGLVFRRTNGAIIVVYSLLNRRDEVQKVLNDQVKFIESMLPVLHDFFPITSSLSLLGRREDEGVKLPMR
jgi:EpsI family protein